MMPKSLPPRLQLKCVRLLARERMTAILGMHYLDVSAQLDHSIPAWDADDS